jgi:hypothetical protein
VSEPTWITRISKPFKARLWRSVRGFTCFVIAALPSPSALRGRQRLFVLVFADIHLGLRFVT